MQGVFSALHQSTL